MRKKEIVRIVLPVLALMIFAAVFYYIAAYNTSENEETYSGNGIYSLSTMEPFSVSNASTNNEICILEPDFSTDTARISVKNAGASNIAVYLFVTDPETGERAEAAEMEIPSGKTKTFTNLTSAKTYQIGVHSSKQYAILIKD